MCVLPSDGTHIMHMSVYQLIILYTRSNASWKEFCNSTYTPGSFAFCPQKHPYSWIGCLFFRRIHGIAPFDGQKLEMKSTIHKKSCFCGQDGTKQNPEHT